MPSTLTCCSDVPIMYSTASARPQSQRHPPTMCCQVPLLLLSIFTSSTTFRIFFPVLFGLLLLFRFGWRDDRGEDLHFSCFLGCLVCDNCRLSLSGLVDVLGWSSSRSLLGLVWLAWLGLGSVADEKSSFESCRSRPRRSSLSTSSTCREVEDFHQCDHCERRCED